MSELTDEQKRAEALLDAAGVFFFDPECDNEDDPDYASFRHTLNMNDVWCWACADGCDVTPEELPEVARLYRAYGWCGILYFAANKEGITRSEFADNNRFIDFVRQEEKVLKEVPGSSERAYHKVMYTLGEEDGDED